MNKQVHDKAEHFYLHKWHKAELWEIDIYKVACKIAISFQFMKEFKPELHAFFPQHTPKAFNTLIQCAGAFYPCMIDVIPAISH